MHLPHLHSRLVADSSNKSLNLDGHLDGHLELGYNKLDGSQGGSGPLGLRQLITV